MAIRNYTKGGGALYNAKELVLVAAHAGTHPQTTKEDVEGLTIPPQDDNAPTSGISSAAKDWLEFS